MKNYFTKEDYLFMAQNWAKESLELKKLLNKLQNSYMDFEEHF